jgi:hypothetical protein
MSAGDSGCRPSIPAGPSIGHATIDEALASSAANRRLSKSEEGLRWLSVSIIEEENEISAPDRIAAHAEVRERPYYEAKKQ